MDSFATQPEAERRILFQEAAAQRNLLPIIFEKDFWVCWTLKRLFESSRFASYLTFKGGTSLSKAYGLIDRFSEDLDLTINRHAAYLCDDKDPMEEGVSGKERTRRIETLIKNTQQFISSVVLPELDTAVQRMLGTEEGWELTFDKEDPTRQTLLFFYPQALNYNVASFPLLLNTTLGYIKPVVRLEFGARGDIEPHEIRSIHPYVADIFPHLFSDSRVKVPTLAQERTFWEKVTILHALYHGSRLRERVSRHYYDTCMMARQGTADIALNNPALLEQVVRNKNLLFKDPKASYETARLGSLRLVPPAERLLDLQRDYEAMQEMFMAVSPAFQELVDELTVLEHRLNHS